MADVISILLTTLCVLYVLARAMKFDRTLPWFEDESTPADGHESSAGRTAPPAKTDRANSERART